MGEGVTDEQELVITIGDRQAGGTQGQLILDDITFGGERDNTELAGLGNDTTQAIAFGNQTYSLSFTEHLNGAAADLFLTAYRNEEDIGGTIRTPDIEFVINDLEWNSFDVEASDDGGSVTIAMDSNAIGVTPRER